MLFSELNLHERLQKALSELQFEQATPVQVQTLPLALSGKDLMVSSETGSGKTAAFVLSMLQKMLEVPAPDSSTRGLILVPTRELGLQVLKDVEALARFTMIKTGLIVGGDDYRHQVNTLRKNPEILIATPGRLIEHIDNSNHDFSDLEYLVLDEADRMLDMGFGTDVLKIVEQCRVERQTFLFSATLEAKGVRGMAEQVLSNPERLRLNSIKDKHANIHQQIMLADDISHKEKLLIWLLKNETYEKAIVFTNTRARADAFLGKIKVKGLRAGVLHGEMDQRERKHVMRLLQEGTIQILVATDVAARGLDIKGINLVINLEMARNGEDYVHRIGRTGRAGEQGLAVSLIGPDEWNRMAGIERFLRISFEKRGVKELRGSYKGPKKVKNSGKAAGKKKKPCNKKSAKKSADNKSSVKKSAAKSAAPKRNKVAKPEQVTSPRNNQAIDAGFEPPKRKK